MTKSENTSLLLIGAAGFVAYMMWKKRAAIGAAAGKAGALPRELWGGGLASAIPDVIVDYFSGRSVSQVLANPGPLFQREVLDYRQEGGNYTSPVTPQSSSIWENFFGGTWSTPVSLPSGEGGASGTW